MSIRRIALFLILALLATTACSTLGLGTRSPVIDRIRSTGELRVGMTGDYPPLNLIDRRGGNIGLEPDLAGALAATLGVDLVVVNKPFAEMIPALQAGEVDMIMSGMTMTAERNLDVAFAGPYFISGKSVLTRSSRLASITSAEELDRSSLALAALEGTTSESFVQRAMPNAKLVVAKNYEQGVRMVIDGEVDGMIADYPVCVLSVLRNRGQGLVTLGSPFTFEPIGMALPANDALFTNMVQNYLTTLEGTGLLDALRAKWFDGSSWLRELP